MKIILASNNAGKLREFKSILEPYGCEVIPQSEAGVNEEAEENGSSFEENAYIKAELAHRLTGLPVIADDSGLEVDYLDGEPGIYSARYAEPGKRCDKILEKLNGVPDEKRTARFVCVICRIDERGEASYFRGECEGRIGYEKRGTNGFGYDPIFMCGEKSFAELSSEEKNHISHRAKALEKLESAMEN